MDNWRAEIEQTIRQEDDAWCRGDAQAFSRPISADCVFTNIFGQVFVGNQAFEQQHARIFAGIYKGSELKQTVDHVRLVAADVAVSDTSVVLTVPASSSGPARALHTKLLQVFVKSGEQWQIVAYHNVEERELAAP